MFNENLKAIRKSKGFTQEDLAIKVNVVRQTVSKWEKGLSVPDAITLQKIADILDVSVSELLGAEMKEENNRNEIAEQLARINEQLAIKNRRWNIFWKIVGVIILGLILLNIVGLILFTNIKTDKLERIDVEEMIIEKE
ncbi:MAG: helix-turn-helix transcriptional regulator [Clostridium sp.]|uniref:helix-turn-helix domain-containing protein n=1 Tax=Clostridium sp. TaxID=1506 RepID=UPI0025BAE4E5|nr:helix-turn-helix transcriptional regulator [Clostridium sp.]MCF0149315.1 helix-turn-helix transcriptional regulator [Clostridium sp.]